jgi:hypothetical protein
LDNNEVMYDFLLTRVCDRGHSSTADARTTPQSTGEKGIMRVMASIRKHYDWDDPEANEADKSDDLALLSALLAIVVIWGAAFLLT